jgi:sporulation protein YlmC with PRC-barrel domain
MADVTKITSGTLIAADKVKGTNVYNPEGEKLGTVDDVMIDKVSGKAIYAVMSFGGFLGIGEKYHPLPWSSLNGEGLKRARDAGVDRAVFVVPPEARDKVLPLLDKGADVMRQAA